MQGYVFASPLWGLRYDARMCTANPLIDWSFGAAAAYNYRQSLGSREDYNYKTDYEYKIENTNYLTLHGLILIGKKDFTFQTGLTLGIHDYQSNRTDTSYNPATPNIYSITKSKFSGKYMTLLVPVGVRYQPAKRPIMAWIDLGAGIYTSLDAIGGKINGVTVPVGVSPSMNLQIGVGYSFAGKH
jgi:hypothetical protein